MSSDGDKLSSLPLDERVIEVNNKNGEKTAVPAVSIGFMKQQDYIPFRPLPVQTNDSTKAYEDEWLECASFLEEDLTWILRLPHHRFWSQVTYDEKLHKCLESYFSRAPRAYDVEFLKISDEVSLALNNIHKLVFQVFLRMSTRKESKEHHITPEYFGNLIYDNYVFDVPKIMDLCSIYGIHNKGIVSKMVQNIFSLQPKYFDDLSRTSQIVLDAFSNIEEKLMSFQDLKEPSLQTANGAPSSAGFPLSSFHDIVNYITDVSFTIYALLDVFPNACQTFYQNGAALRIATFYEQTFGIVEREISKQAIRYEIDGILDQIKRKVRLSKTLMVETFRNILNYCCIQDLVSAKSSDDNKQSSDAHLNQYFDIFTEVIPAKNFLEDYNVLYPIEADFTFFSELGLQLDQQRANYILCAIHDIGDNNPPTFTSSVENGARPKTKTHDSNTNLPSTIQGAADLLRSKTSSEPEKSDTINSSENGACGVEVNSMVTSICECLGLTDRKFIERCLDYFNRDVDRVIDAYVTDNIPEQLKTSNDAINGESVSEQKKEPEPSILDDRKCVFDNDEFDLFRRTDVNLKNIHLGKKNKTPSVYESLSSDKGSGFLKQFALMAGYEETEYVEEKNLYEDEYDDTYDSQMIGLKEPAPEGVPDVDDKRAVDEHSGDTNEPPSRDTSKDFCENPEVVRQRREQRWAEKMAARGGGGGGRRGGGAPPPSNDENRNRQHKDRNKAHVGNHNRRKQSDFKRSRGMLPQ